jgi:prolyl-tRNA synthetase
VVKVLLLLARFEDGFLQPLLVSLRGDQQLNEVKLANAISGRCAAEHGTLLELAPLTAEAADREGLNALPFGTLGPQLQDAVLAGARNWSPRFLRLADATATALEAFVCGANARDQHLVGASWGRLPRPDGLDLRAAQPGDRCRHDPCQVLEASRGIEVGHIFQLGRKYSRRPGGHLHHRGRPGADPVDGLLRHWCLRLAQAAVEQRHDANGICWPHRHRPLRGDRGGGQCGGAGPAGAGRAALWRVCRPPAWMCCSTTAPSGPV